MESCGMSVIKYILFIFNLIFALSGVGIIVAGGVVLAEVGTFRHFVEARILAPPIVLIVAGSIVFVVAFLGCCGAIKENYTMLMAFAGLLLIIFIVELAVGIAAAVAKDDFADTLRTTLKASMANYTADAGEKLAWNNVQTELKCCGVEGYTDWEAVMNDPTQLPPSCCKSNAPKEDGTTPAPTDGSCLATAGEDIYPKGCYDKLKEILKSAAVVVMGVGIGIAFIELVGIVFACCLASAIKKQEENMK